MPFREIVAIFLRELHITHKYTVRPKYRLVYCQVTDSVKLELCFEEFNSNVTSTAAGIRTRKKNSFNIRSNCTFKLKLKCYVIVQCDTQSDQSTPMLRSRVQKFPA